MYLLDTNACIYYLNGTYPELVRRVLAEGPGALAVSSISVAELHFGAERSGRAGANLARIQALLRELRTVPFSSACAARFGRVKAELMAAGTPIADFDIAIASTALAMGFTVVTNDLDFRRVPGLAVETWTSGRFSR